MGQKKVRRTLDWRKQHLHVNVNAHVKYLRQKWLEEQKKTPESDETAKLEEKEEVKDEPENKKEDAPQLEKSTGHDV